ncbi:FG-GAP repeat domain-containing protein, partial [Kribbella albertanoniae]
MRNWTPRRHRLTAGWLIAVVLSTAFTVPAGAADHQQTAGTAAENRVRRVSTERMTIVSGGTTTRTIRCEEGETATGGGAFDVDHRIEVVQSSVEFDGRGWTVGLHNPSSWDTQPYGWVMCVRGITTSRTVGSMVAVGPGQTASARASCAPDRTLLGGGPSSSTLPGAVVAQSRPDGPPGYRRRDWLASVYNNSEYGHEFNIWAVCASGLTSVRYVEDQPVGVRAGHAALTWVSCPPGTFVLAGGHRAEGWDARLVTSSPRSATEWNIAVRNPNWDQARTFVPMAVCGSFEVPWTEWAKDPKVQAIAGDVNRDGAADLMMVGGEAWTAQPVAVSAAGAGSYFGVRAHSVDARWAEYAEGEAELAGQVVQGDFNGDGRADLARVGNYWSPGMPVVFAGTGEDFRFVDRPVDANWRNWSMDWNVHPVTGDFDNDGKDDIALAGGAGWTTQPVAYSNGDGTFRVTNRAVDSSWA